MSILVTGSSGFLGKHLIKRLLVNGFNVVALSRSFAPQDLSLNPQLKWIQMDISKENIDVSMLPKIDAVIHLAGATSVEGDDEVLFLQSNEQTTIRLFQNLASLTSRFIIASSQEVYGNPKHCGVSEDFPIKPYDSSYACSKVNSENWLRMFQQQHGGQYLLLRFSGFIEGGGLIDYLINQALRGDSLELFSEGKVCRDYLSVDEGIGAIIASLHCSYISEFLPINIGSGQKVSAKDLAELICQETNSTSQIKLVSTQAPKGNFVFKIDRAKRELNFSPSNLRSAVRKYTKSRMIQNKL